MDMYQPCDIITVRNKMTGMVRTGEILQVRDGSLWMEFSDIGEMSINLDIWEDITVR